MKLYVIIAKHLAAGLKIAQACHALRAFVAEHEVIERFWFQESNNIVCLEHEDISGLKERLEEKGYRLSAFYEPDLNDQMTALCVEPAAARHLSDLRLAESRAA